jgi:hypothetical protein
MATPLSLYVASLFAGKVSLITIREGLANYSTFPNM